MESDVKESDPSQCLWRVDEEDEAKYNFSDEKGVWQPKPEDILSMFDQLAKGGTLPLQWKCPGRRPPESEKEADNSEETNMEVDKEDAQEEESREPEPCAFDFDDTQSDTSVKTTPMRVLGGPGRTPRPEKRVARMDNIMDSLRKQKLQRAAEREARKAKASPGRMSQGRGRLLKFGSPQTPKTQGDATIKPSGPVSTLSISQALLSTVTASATEPVSLSHPLSSLSSVSVTNTTLTNINNNPIPAPNVISENQDLLEKDTKVVCEGVNDKTTVPTLPETSCVPISVSMTITSLSSSLPVPEVSTSNVTAQSTTTTSSFASSNQNPDEISANTTTTSPSLSNNTTTSSSSLSNTTTSSSSSLSNNTTISSLPSKPSVTEDVSTTTLSSSSPSTQPPTTASSLLDQSQPSINPPTSKPESTTNNTTAASTSNVVVTQPQSESVVTTATAVTSTLGNLSVKSELSTNDSSVSGVLTNVSTTAVLESSSIHQEAKASEIVPESS